MQPNILGARLFEVLKFGKKVDKIFMGHLKPNTRDDNLFIIYAVVKIISFQ